jgi:hypothetical protein
MNPDPNDKNTFVDDFNVSLNLDIDTPLNLNLDLDTVLNPTEAYMKMTPEEQKKIAFTKVLEYITNTFYRTNENNEISIVLSKNNKADNYYDQYKIVLSEQLIDIFGDLNLPRFIIYYHELGHHLYSIGLFKLQEAWMKNTKGSTIEYNQKYDHLVNWIEDYFIENKLVIEHPYLTDVLNCIKKLPPDFDIKAIDYAFNYWYIYQTPTPALSYIDQVVFKGYITKLLSIRDTSSIRFGYGVVSDLTMKPTIETKFVKLIIEFHTWCVAKGILPNDTMPQLSNPNNHIQQPGQGQGQGQGQGNGQPNPNAQSSGGGSSSDHSRTVGKTNKYTEAYHIKSPTAIFKDDIAQENKLIDYELMDMSQRIQANTSTLDGLFTTKHKESAVIQSKIILPNFFNPQHLIDQILFLQKQHTYMNVAIFRDISGSTEGERHLLMSFVCEQLYKDIPVNIQYHLYASGDISIIEVPYVKWDVSNNPPPSYKNNPLFSQLGGGTNSDAIADVITQQLSDKWLNIILTDGDLNALMRRSNIKELLKNVFIIAVDSDVEPGLLGVRIDTVADVYKINSILSTINLDR